MSRETASHAAQISFHSEIEGFGCAAYCSGSDGKKKRGLDTM
jgi:hypothetical protein